MAKDGKIKYELSVDVGYFKQRLQEAYNGLSDFKSEIDNVNRTTQTLGKKTDLSKVVSDLDKVSDALKQVSNESGKFSLNGHGVDNNLQEIIQKTGTLKQTLAELNKQKEILMRGGEIGKDDDMGVKSLNQVLAQIKVVQDEIKRINGMDLNKILDAQAKTQFNEVTAAINAQKKAIDAYNNSIEKSKAMQETYFKRNSATFNGANAVLEKYGIDKQVNPYDGGYSEYLKSNATQFSATVMERYEQAMLKFYGALQKGDQLTDAELSAKIKEYQKLVDEIQHFGGKAVNPYSQFENANAYNRKSLETRFTTLKEAESVFNRLQSKANHWNTAFAKGKQITQEELEIEQRITKELEKQHDITLTGKSNPRNVLMQYSSAEEFNRASLEAKSNNAISKVARETANEVQSYKNAIKQLENQCESLYATYRKDPSKSNLQAFAQTQAALQNTRKHYREYQETVNETSKTLAEFGRKAMSHFQWIATGYVIAEATSSLYNLEDELTNLDAKVANIRQVIPQIEANPHLISEDYNEYIKQVNAMNKAMDEFIGTAAKYGQSTDEVLDATRSIGRMYGQGDKGVINTRLFADQAAKMAVADNFSMEEATKGLEAAMSQWNLQTEDSNELMARSSEIIDIWTRAAHSGAASGQDIGQAIEVAGAAAAQAGVSFQFFTSLVETGVRTTARSGNEIGQALKSLFVTMGSGKVEGALNQWGIKTKEIGSDGREHMRSLEQQILDVSLAVSSTDKDTTQFLSKLSGGKYQYSKIAAILKNYKEILRMQGVLNDGKTKGFADEQVAVQLDTIQRKVQQVRAEGERLVASFGNAGGFEGLKWLAEKFKDVTTGVRLLNEEAGKGKTNILVITKYATELLATLAAIKTVSFVIGKIVEGYTAKKTATEGVWGNIPREVSGENGGLFADSRARGREKGEKRAARILSEYGIETTATKANTTVTNENTVAKEKNAVANTTESMAEHSSAEAKNHGTSATVNETRTEVTSTGATIAHTNAKTKEAAADKVATAAKMQEVTANRTEAISEVTAGNAVNARNLKVSAGTAITKAFTWAEINCTYATRILSAAVAALGGPIGVAALALLALSTDVIFSAKNMGELENATEKTIEGIDEMAQKATQAMSQVQRQESAVDTLCQAYNKLSSELKSCSADSDVYKAKQEQMGDILNTLKEIVGEEGIEFLKQNGFKKEAVVQLMAKQKEAAIEKQKEAIAQNNAEIEATKTTISSISARISALKSEVEAVKNTGTAWSWLHNVITNSKANIAKHEMERANELLAEANNYYDPNESSFMLRMRIDNYGGVEKAKEVASDVYNKFYARYQEAVDELAANGDTDVVNGVIEELQGNLAESEKALSLLQDNGKKLNADLVELQKQGSKFLNEPTDHSIPDDTNYSKPKGNKGKSTESKKQTIDYANDPLSNAIHIGAQSDTAKRYGFGEDLLRAIAALESGGGTTIRQDVQNGEHIGLMQVTQADAERFFGAGANVAEPMWNVATAVQLLAEKYDMYGSMAEAIKHYGEGTDAYLNRVQELQEAQNKSFSFNGKDDSNFAGYTSYNDAVINELRATSGLTYGGSSWRDVDETAQAVCTTWLQNAMIKAGADQGVVEGLSAWAPNWASNAGSAFHSYADVKNGGYVPVGGDVVITNNGDHVIMLGKNGQGYWAAGGSGHDGKSGYYEQNYKDAFGGSIVGVVSLNELTGKPYTQSIAPNKKKPKSINDFQLDRYAEMQYKQTLDNEKVESATLEGKRDDFLNGGASTKAKIDASIAQLRYTNAKLQKTIQEGLLSSVNHNIEAYLNAHPDIIAMLKKRGTTWEQLVPAEREALAALANDESFSKMVKNQEDIRLKVVETTKAVEEQLEVFEKAIGYMNPDEQDTYRLNRLQDDYDIDYAMGDDGHVGAMELARQKNLILEKQLARREAEYEKVKEEGNEIRRQLQEQIKEKESQLAMDIAKRDVGGGSQSLTDSINEKTDALKRLKQEYNSSVEVGTLAEQKCKEAVNETTKAIKNNDKELNRVSMELKATLTSGITTMFHDMLLEGKSFSDAWKGLWKNIASFALQQLLRVQLQKVFGKLGWFSEGGVIPGKATGGVIPGYATGGQTAGAITGAGTGTSDSILAYIANKDRFVYLSNGEYVMTAEATQRIGKDNLDRMNYGRYAVGGALSGVPYVPNLSTSVTRKARNINRNNPNARMEELLAQQTEVLRNVGDGGNGGFVVLNTQASSQDVIRALQENPRAVQAIMGRQKHMGFR